MNKGLNANSERFYVINVQGKTMLFLFARIDRTTVPNDVYVYEVRYNDCAKGEPAQIANYINTHFLGTLLSRYPLKLEQSAEEEYAFYNINAKQEWHFEGIMLTIQKYLEKYQ